MEFRKMTMKMLADFVAVSNNAVIQFWRDEAQRGLDSCGDRGSQMFFVDAIECLNAEAKKRADAATVPSSVLEMLRHMNDETLIKTRGMITRTTVPIHDEQRAARVANFIKAINAELNGRNKVGSAFNTGKPDPFAEFASQVPEDLRGFFTEKSPEGPTRKPDPFAEFALTGNALKPGAGMVLSLAALEYLCLAIAAFEDADEATEKTIGVPLYQRVQQLREILTTLIAF